MSPGTRLPDRELLARLLHYAAVTGPERQVFQGWFDDLTGGTRIELSPKERLWVESSYYQQGTGAQRAAARKRNRAAEQAKREAATFAPTALPKRPPGR